jgi:hypothetical protein
VLAAVRCAMAQLRMHGRAAAPVVLVPMLVLGVAVHSAEGHGAVVYPPPRNAVDHDALPWSGPVSSLFFRLGRPCHSSGPAGPTNDPVAAVAGSAQSSRRRVGDWLVPCLVGGGGQGHRAQWPGVLL